jgi:hypothetical protein
MPVTPAFWGGTIRIAIQGLLRRKVRLYLKNNQHRKHCGVTKAVVHLHNKREALSSALSTIKS